MSWWSTGPSGSSSGWSACGWCGAWSARKDLNRAGWIILTIFFPIIGLIIVAILPAKQRPTPPETLP